MTNSGAILDMRSAPGAEAARPPLKRALVAGVIAGQISGLIMAVVVMAVFTIFLGRGPLYPVQVIGSFAFGDGALVGFHAPAFLAGLVLHQLGPALFWSAAFAAAVHAFGLRRGAGMAVLALATGLASQLVDVNLILRLAMDALHGHNIWAEQVPAFWSWAAHLVFGLGLAVYPWVENKLSARAA